MPIPLQVGCGFCTTQENWVVCGRYHMICKSENIYYLAPYTESADCLCTINKVCEEETRPASDHMSELEGDLWRPANRHLSELGSTFSSPSPAWRCPQLDYNLVINHEPDVLCQAGSLAHRNCKITNVCCFKLLNFGDNLLLSNNY